MLVTEEDFNRLWDTSMAWGNEWRSQDGRFEPSVTYDWAQAYWFELAYANLILARVFLDQKGYEYEISSDEAGGWVLLTNYVFKGAMV